MKKSVACLMMGVLAFGVTALASCTPSSDPNTLNIVCLNKGYGRAWIDEIVAKWEEENPDYKINLTAESDAPSIIDSHLASKNNTDDLYISVGSKWRTYAASGKLLALDDLLEETVDGKKVKDKVSSEYRSSIYYGEHSYRLPWTSGIGGIYYNHAMFEQYGWEVPTTYDELLSLVNTINAAKKPVVGSKTDVIKPFIYTGQNTDYFDYAVFTWWGQLAGKEAIDEFLKYEKPDSFDSTLNPTYAKLKEATQLWANLFAEGNYVTGSANKTNHQAQQDFLNGYAAMMFNSDWLYNEMLGYSDTGVLPETFDLRLMSTPTAPNAVYPHTSYIVGEDQYIAIPKTSGKPELAKSFIKLMISDFGCETFVKNSNALLAYDWNTTSYTPSNNYVASLINYKQSLTSTYTNFSSNVMYLSGIIDIWGKSAYRPFEGIVNTGAYTVESAFIRIADEVKRNWNTWRTEAGL